MKVVAICDIEHAMGLIGLLSGSVLVWDVSRSLEISRECVWMGCEDMIETMDEFAVIDGVHDMFHISTYDAGPDEMQDILAQLTYDQVVLCCDNADHIAQYSFAKPLLTMKQVDNYTQADGIWGTYFNINNH